MSEEVPRPILRRASSSRSDTSGLAQTPLTSSSSAASLSSYTSTVSSVRKRTPNPRRSDIIDGVGTGRTANVRKKIVRVALDRTKQRGHFVWDYNSKMWFNTRTKYFYDDRTKRYSRSPDGKFYTAEQIQRLNQLKLEFLSKRPAGFVWDAEHNMGSYMILTCLERNGCVARPILRICSV